jgi:hypothetical protein
MKSSVPRIMIFPEAVRAHDKTRHSSVRPIIGDGSRYGISRAAVRAVDKGIEVSSVSRIEQFVQAVIADRDIGRDQGKRQTAGLVHTGVYGKIGITVKGKRNEGNIGNPRERWGFASKSLHELRDMIALHVDEHSLARVGHISLEVEGISKVEDVGPEADALYDAFDYDLSPLSH